MNLSWLTADENMTDMKPLDGRSIVTVAEARRLQHAASYIYDEMVYKALLYTQNEAVYLCLASSNTHRRNFDRQHRVERST